MTEEEKRDIRSRFFEHVNMAPAEIEKWLQTKESKEVGWDSGDGESVGHKSGIRIVAIRHKKVGELTDDDHAHMKKVNGYVARHLAQRPASGIKDSRWRYSLMNWGHDPCKDGC